MKCRQCSAPLAEPSAFGLQVCGCGARYQVLARLIAWAPGHVVTPEQAATVRENKAKEFARLVPLPLPYLPLLPLLGRPK